MNVGLSNFIKFVKINKKVEKANHDIIESLDISYGSKFKSTSGYTDEDIVYTITKCVVKDFVTLEWGSARFQGLNTYNVSIEELRQHLEDGTWVLEDYVELEIQYI